MKCVRVAKSSEIQRSGNMISRHHCFCAFIHLHMHLLGEREDVSVCLSGGSVLFSFVGKEGECLLKGKKANVVRR